MVHRPTVVLLTTNFDIGGAERVYAYLARGLRDLGYWVIAVCLQIRSGALREHLGPGIEVVDMGMASKMDVRAADARSDYGGAALRSGLKRVASFVEGPFRLGPLIEATAVKPSGDAA